MIFYFSGSGNSYHAAKVMAEGLGDRMVDLAKAQREQSFSYTLQKGEKLGFIFPVHAWAPPLVVEQFIRQLELYYEGELYTYAVCTCGQSAGETMAILEAALRENGLTLGRIIMQCFSAHRPRHSRHSCSNKQTKRFL